MTHCAECGFTYDLSVASAAGKLIGDGTSEVAALLRQHAGTVSTRRQTGVWSPLEYGCHVRDVLLVQRERILAARRADGVVCEPMGRDERVEHDGYAEQEPEDVARQVTDAALLIGNVLDRLTAGDWTRSLVYPFPEPNERSLQWVAIHTLHEVRHHLLDIRRQLDR